MANDYKKQLRDFENAVNNALKTFTSGSKIKKYADQSVDIIYKRTKSGKGVTDDQSNAASIKSLKTLSPGYKEQRKTRKGKKGDFFSPNRSNLTLTGQMLDSIKSKVSDGKITVSLSGTRDDGQTNKEVGEFVSENGRPFLNLAVEEKQILLRKIETDLIKFVRLLFNKRG